MNASEQSNLPQVKSVAKPRGNGKRTIPPEVLQEAVKLVPNLQREFPDSGRAAVELEALCKKHGVSFSSAVKHLGLKPTSLFCDFQLGAHFGDHVARFEATYRKITRSHYRHLFEIAGIDEALSCLRAAVEQTTGKRKGLTCAALGSFVKAKIQAGAYTPRPKKKPGAITRATVKRSVENALARARLWDCDHEVIMYLNEAARVMQQPQPMTTAQTSK